MSIVIFAEIQINLSCFVLSFRQKLDGYFRRISALKALTKKKMLVFVVHLDYSFRTNPPEAYIRFIPQESNIMNSNYEKIKTTLQAKSMLHCRTLRSRNELFQ